MTLNKILWVTGLWVMLLVISGCSTDRQPYRAAKTVKIDDQYKNICGLRRPPAGADVAAGRKPSKAQIEESKLLNDLPSGEVWYEGTRGVVTQYMRAIPRAPLCRMGSRVVFSLPKDTSFNRGCCPPGLIFSGKEHGVIEGIPTKPGHYKTRVILCARCKSSIHTIPVVAHVEWNIEGHQPRRIE